MLLELQHFVYSLYPKQGYGVTAASPGIDKQSWRAYCAPPPVELQDVEKLGKIWALQKVGNEVVLSMFAPGLKDEFNRPGIHSHNILIPIQVYLKIGASPIAFVGHFITNTNTAGELPLLTLRTEDLQMQPDFDLLATTKPNTLEKILEQIIRGNAITIICPGRDTEQMTAWVSAMCQLLILSDRIVPFITAPLSRTFKREHNLERFTLKLVNEPSGEENINIDKDYPVQAMTTPEGKIAHHLVEQFRNQGYDQVKTMHTMWEKEKTKESKASSAAENFVTALEVSRDAISIESIIAMSNKGKKAKEDAKRSAIAILDQRKWKNIDELTELIGIIVEGSPQQSIGQEIQRLLNEKTQALEASERFGAYDRMINKFPRFGNELFSKLKEQYGVALIIEVKDLSKSPEIASRLLNLADYASFESVSKQILQGSVSDAGLFERNLRYVMDAGRKQFGRNALDFTLYLLTNFRDRKGMIIQQLQKEDLIYISPKSHLSKDDKNRLLEQAEKILQVLKSVISP